ncbi:MAG: nucleotidyltransferase family protein [Pseudomonadales bacterium]
MDYRAHITHLMHSDALRMRALAAVQSLALPDWLIAAGFVRNCIWDDTYAVQTPLNDIDVIYFCSKDTTKARDEALEAQLRAELPQLPWSVKNQARMHLKHDDAAYRNTLDAMRHWPEKQTAIGVMLDTSGEVVVRHAFDLAYQFNGKIDHNSQRPLEVFQARVERKGWLQQWPQLKCDTVGSHD